jgi:steroid delta-isomerase-like uncharacterized protein
VTPADEGRAVNVDIDAATTAASNKATQRRYVEQVQNGGDVAAVDEFLAPDAVNHTPAPGLPGTRDGAKRMVGMMRAAFPDHDAVVVHMVAEGDLVATYKTLTGTHRGEFMGIAPTNRRVTIRIMDFVRYRDGKVAEHWNIVDVIGLLRQLGVVDGRPAAGGDADG